MVSRSPHPVRSGTHARRQALRVGSSGRNFHRREGAEHAQWYYVSVEPFHLFRYLDEQVFRYNNRKMNAGNRFKIVLREMSRTL
jgi:hypothetical protein